MKAFGTRAVWLALLSGLFVFSTACSGGGGGESTPTFTVTSIEPSQSEDLNGGGTAIVRGTNFLSARAARVLFGDGNPGFNLDVKSQTELWITIPPSPSGNAGPVNLEVQTLDRGTKGIFAGFTYGDGGNQPPAGPPKPTTITPTFYTPTGAQNFIIGGSDFGSDGSKLIVEFQGVGIVEATVTGGGTLLTGRAPVASPVPTPVVPVEVRVRNDPFEAVVPTRVTFTYFAPTVVPGITYFEGNANASLPVRVALDKAVVATSTDVAWANGNDDLMLITVDASTNTISPLRSLLAGQSAARHNLDRFNSAPIALNGDTVCISTLGVNTAGASGDEEILVISNLSSPTPNVASIGPLTLSKAPIVRISSTRIAFTTIGTGGTAAAPSDQLWVVDIVNGFPTTSRTVDIGITDNVVNAGLGGLSSRRVRSVPFSPDGDAVFVYARCLAGFNTPYGDFDDVVTRYVVSTGTTAVALMPFLLTKPVALSANRVVAPATWMANPAVNPDPFDIVSIVDFAGSAGNPTVVEIGSFVSPGATFKVVALKDGNFVMPIGAAGQPAGTLADRIGIFTDDGSGAVTMNSIAVAFRPLLTSVGDGVMVFGPGLDGVRGSGGDRTFYIAPTGEPSLDFTSAPDWLQGSTRNLGPPSDGDRVFALGQGDQAWNNANEVLHVFQVRALDAFIDATTVPLAASATSNVDGNVPFVPIGSNWGLMLSTGMNGAWQNNDDRLIVVYY